MFKHSMTLGLATLFLWVSAVLHMATPAMGGFGSQALTLVGIGVLFAVIALLLPGNRRWLAWLTFFMTLFGGIAALSSAIAPDTLPALWHWLILAANWLSALMLFGYLWNPKPAGA